MNTTTVGIKARLARHPLVHSSAFRNFFLADVFVTVAERYFVLTFAWWLLTPGNGDGARLGLLMVVESAPTLVLGILLGPVIDRASKKQLMLMTAVAQALVVSGVAFALATGALSFPLLCAAGFALGCLLPAFEGAINAALPEVVRDDQLAAATAVQSSTLEFSNIIAATLSATLVATLGFEVAAIANAGLYAVGALFVLRLRFDSTKPASSESYSEDLRAGLRYLAREPGLLPFLGVYAGKLLFTVPLLVVIPMLVGADQRWGVGWVGTLEVGFSAGAIVTALLISLRQSHTRLRSVYAAGLAALGVLMLTLTAIQHPLAMLPILVVMGGAVAVLLSLSHILFQLTVRDEFKGRFFGLLETLGASVTPLGYAAVGLVSAAHGPRGVLSLSGFGLLALCAVLLLTPSPARAR